MTLVLNVLIREISHIDINECRGIATGIYYPFARMEIVMKNTKCNKTLFTVKNFLKAFIFEKILRKQPQNKVETSALWDLHKADSFKNEVRVASNLIKSDSNPKGVFRRDELVTIYNPGNGKYVSAQVRGSGSTYKKMYASTIAIDYTHRVALGLPYEGNKHDLKIWKSRSFEINNFLSNQTLDLAARYTYRMTVKQYRVNLVVGFVLATGVLSYIF
jgi:hypothetical protein